MANMSYCRFANTLSDFNDCVIALEDYINGEEEINRTERRKAAELIAAAVGLIQTVSQQSSHDFDEICDMTDEQLNELIDQMNGGCDEEAASPC